jgi:hypothetical protein
VSDLTYDQLSATATIADADLLAVYVISDSLLKKIDYGSFKTVFAGSLTSIFLSAASNLSDVASASSARANLGLGTAAVLAASGVFQVANNFSEVANAAAARTNIGAAASDAPTITSGMTFSGAAKQNVQAVASTSIDVSISEFQTKAISSNTTFTFTGATSTKGQGFLLKLTISSAAIPTWPASVKWEGGIAPILANGIHWLSFLSDNGTDWYGSIYGSEYA